MSAPVEHPADFLLSASMERRSIVAVKAPGRCGVTMPKCHLLPNQSAVRSARVAAADVLAAGGIVQPMTSMDRAGPRQKEPSFVLRTITISSFASCCVTTPSQEAAASVR
jgi:hypothetical protein